MRIVLLGPPGAGKGSLANALKKQLALLHISSGDILREEVKNQTPLGKEAKGYIDRGELVPDDLITRLMANSLAKDPRVKTGYILDGFPRTGAQARDLDEILAKLNLPLDYAVYLDTSLPIVIQRLSGRRVCRSCGALFHVHNRPPKKEDVCDSCGGVLYQRPDDNEATIRTRMDVYLKSTLPIIEYYQAQGRLRKLDGNRNSEELERILLNALHDDGKHDTT